MTDSEYRDELPEDLQPALASRPYELPTTKRRRIMASLCWGFAAFSLLTYALSDGDGVYVNKGALILAIALVLVGAYFWLAGWIINTKEQDAMVVATKETGMVVGHASAHLGWIGLRSRPTWRLLLYSNENPPKERAVVLVDAVEGKAVYSDRESNPEDWSQLVN